MSRYTLSEAALVPQRQFGLIILLITIGMFLLGGCSEEDGSAGTDTGGTMDTGVFIDSPVQGLDFSGPGASGTTDSAGTFRFRRGGSVTFSLGDIPLGSGIGRSRFTPLDLVSEATAPTNPWVLNRLRFLQTLDSDGDPSNGITIDASTRSASIGHGAIDFTASPFNPNLSALTGNPLVSATDALNHFNQVLQQEDPGFVDTVSPAHGETGVAQGLLNTGPFITVVFLVDMNPATLNDQTVLVYAANTDPPTQISGLTISYDSPSKTLTISKPGTNLGTSILYSVILTNGIADTNGTSPRFPYSWSFLSSNTDLPPPGDF